MTIDISFNEIEDKTMILGSTNNGPKVFLMYLIEYV